MPRRASEKWTLAAVEAAKLLARTELENVPQGDADKDRLQHSLKRVAALEDHVDSQSQLLRFVFVISSLVHHARYGGLTRNQVQRGAELASTILATQQVKPTTSRLAFLHGELHLVLSQIYRKSGDHWHAAWEQSEALHSSRRQPPGGLAFMNLASGNRALRLGHATLAIQLLTSAENHGLAPSDLEKARLARIKALRLSARREEATQLIAASRSELSGDDAQRELDWELLCLGVAAGEGLPDMLYTLRRGGSHDNAIFLLEGSIWTKAVTQREFMDRLLQVRSMLKRPGLKPQRFGGFFRLALALDDCYDRDIPLGFRIRDLGTALADMSRLTTVDKELLGWVAASRFLARSQATEHAGLALAEYSGLSLRLSDGRSRDVLGIAGDLLDRNWSASKTADDEDLEEAS